MKQLLVGLCLSLCLAPAAQAQQAAPLTEAKVADFLQTRIATNRLQVRMNNNADQYDRVIPAFFRKRKELLKERGWSVKAFKAVEKRIMNARSAMEMANEGNRSLTKQDKAFIDKTRPDWPAVRPYRDELAHLTDWVAGNVPNPPRIGD
jgi:hypothetical protein